MIFRKCFLLFILFAIAHSSMAQIHAGSAIHIPTGGKSLLHSNWVARLAGDVHMSGDSLTRFENSFAGWMPASVPGTVLETLISNGKYPSPYYATNNDSIPDIYTNGNAFYTYWFVNRFSIHRQNQANKYWLNLRGINYKAEVFLNGHKVGKDLHEGMYLREKYDITEFLKTDTTSNTLEYWFIHRITPAMQMGVRVEMEKLAGMLPTSLQPAGIG
jgi:mannosylglycoprotein endo-beta-mannosidase